jgi:ABC-type transport system involved in Fe-S cluster assembly fused permease/ATPase subunit
LQLFDLTRLPVGEHLRQNSVDTELTRHGAGADLVVARDHGYVQTHLLERIERLPRFLPHRVGDRHDTGRLAVDGDEHGRLAFARQLFELQSESVFGDAMIPH